MTAYGKLFLGTALCSATGLGWILGQFTNTSGEGKLKKERNLSALALHGTISAANPQGHVQEYPSANIPVPADAQGYMDDKSPTVTSVPAPASNSSRIAQIMRFGFPSLTNIRALNDYVVSYDTRNRVPFWVFEHLTPESVKRNPSVDRANTNFHKDSSFHMFFRSRNSDYKSSGFDRGHMAAAGNHRKCQEHCDETFLLSNVAPQVGVGFNRHIWNDLEKYCRTLANNFKNVYICTGPLYLPRVDHNDGKMYVHYQVIGHNNVAVPTHYFKIIVCENHSGELSLESYLMPNQRIAENTDLRDFLTNLEIIERSSGMLFFDAINRKKFKYINRKSTGWF